MSVSAASSAPTRPVPHRRGGGGVARADVAALAELVRPVTLAPARTLSLTPELIHLGPIRRGTVVEVHGPGLVLKLLAAPTTEGAWAALIGATELNLAAAAEQGVRLDRLAMVAAPPAEVVASVVASLVEALDVVVLGPAVVAALRTPEVRRLSARIRERGSVVLAMGSWPEPADRRFAVSERSWHGLGQGWGSLQRIDMVIEASGRGAASRPAAHRLAG